MGLFFGGCENDSEIGYEHISPDEFYDLLNEKLNIERELFDAKKLIKQLESEIAFYTTQQCFDSKEVLYNVNGKQISLK